MSNEVIKKEEKYIEEIKKLVENLKYGSLTLIVQDGKVIHTKICRIYIHALVVIKTMFYKKDILFVKFLVFYFGKLK